MGIEDKYIEELRSLGFDESMISSFSNQWKKLADEGYELYAMYKGIAGSKLEKKAACIICSKNTSNLRWEVVITPSMDSAAIYSVCSECDDEFVAPALRQKALGRLLKERNTRPT